MNHELDNSMPDENLIIATAMAERLIKLEKAKGNIGAEIMGHPPDSDEMIDQYTRAHTNLFYSLITEPDSPSADPMSVFDEIDLHTDIRKQYGRTGIDPPGADLTRKQVSKTLKSVGSDGPRFAEELAAAQNLADKNRITVADVYEEDDLYRELRQSIWTPLALAKDYNAIVKTYTRNAAVNFLAAAAAEAFGEKEAKMYQIVSKDPLSRTKITNLIESQKESARQQFYYEAFTIWGPKARRKIDNLPKSLNRTLTPKQPYSPTLKELIAGQR